MNEIFANHGTFVTFLIIGLICAIAALVTTGKCDQFGNIYH